MARPGYLADNLLTCAGLVFGGGAGRRASLSQCSGDVQSEDGGGELGGQKGRSDRGEPPGAEPCPAVASALDRGLLPVAGGTIAFAGSDVTRLRGRRLLPYRRAAQIVFHDGEATLNPRVRNVASAADGRPVHRVVERSAGRARAPGRTARRGRPDATPAPRVTTTAIVAKSSLLSLGNTHCPRRPASVPVAAHRIGRCGPAW